MATNNHAPFSKESYATIPLSVNVLVALFPLYVFSVVFFGTRPLILLCASVLTAMACEGISNWLMLRKNRFQDGTAIVTGALIASVMSPLTPIFVPILASAFAILVVKMPFGGTGRNLFNPAASGIALTTVCFPNLMFMYPDNEIRVSITAFTFDATQAPSPASELFTHAKSSYLWYDLLLGDVPGAIGTTAILILFACAVFLFARRSLSPALTLSFLVTCAVFSLLFPRTDEGRLQSILLELCSGYLFFGSIFFLNDPTTSPSHTLARIVYGVMAGLLVMLLRHFGQFEEGMCFAVMLCNVLASPLDRVCWKLLHHRHKRKEAAA